MKKMSDISSSRHGASGGCSVVWAAGGVGDSHGHAGPVNLSKEAAMEELRFNERHGQRRRTSGITEMHVHTLELARERWSDDQPDATPSTEGGEP